jgi:hypothetical protein
MASSVRLPQVEAGIENHRDAGEFREFLDDTIEAGIGDAPNGLDARRSVDVNLQVGGREWAKPPATDGTEVRPRFVVIKKTVCPGDRSSEPAVRTECAGFWPAIADRSAGDYLATATDKAGLPTNSRFAAMFRFFNA